MKTRTRSTLIALAVTASLTPAMPALAQTDPGRPGAARPGWYLALGADATHLDLSDKALRTVQSSQLGFEALGRGAELMVGYAFDPSFALELRAIGAEHDTDQAAEIARSGQVLLEAIAVLSTKSRVQPYLAGGLGGTSLEIGDLSLEGGMVSMGGGIEVHVRRRFALSFNYRYAIHNYEREVVASTEANLDASGTSHTWGFRGTFSF